MNCPCFKATWNTRFKSVTGDDFVNDQQLIHVPNPHAILKSLS